MAATASPKVIWLVGNSFERIQKLDIVIKAYEGEEVMRFNENYSFAYAEDQIMCNSCFSAKKLVIFDAMPIFYTTRPTFVNQFKKFIDNIPETVLVIFNNITDEKAIQEYVAKNGKIVEFVCKLTRDEAPQWIVGEALRISKTIAIDDASILADSCGFDPKLNGYSVDQLRLAIGKAAYYLGSRKTISRDDVLVTAYPSEEFVVWRIFDAMDSKDIKKCFELFQKMVMNMDDIAGAVETLFTTSLWRFRLLFFLKEVDAKKLSKSQIVKEANQLLKMKQTGLKFHMKLTPEAVDEDAEIKTFKPAYTEWSVNKALGIGTRKAEIDNYSRRDLSRIMQCILESTPEIRLRTSDFALQLLADGLFMTICNQADNELLKAVRATI